MDTTSLIIVICVVIPALLAISICVIIFYSNSDKDRKVYRQRSPSFEYHHSCERVPQDNRIIVVPRAYRHQQRRLPEPPPIFEQPAPPYEIAVNQISRPQLSVFSPIRTTPVITNVQQSSPATTSSVYSAMPPSYAEIFLTPYSLTNR